MLGLIFLLAGVFKVFQLDPSNGRSAVTFTILRVRKLAALLLQFFLTWIVIGNRLRAPDIYSLIPSRVLRLLPSPELERDVLFTHRYLSCLL